MVVSGEKQPRTADPSLKPSPRRLQAACTVVTVVAVLFKQVLEQVLNARMEVEEAQVIADPRRHSTRPDVVMFQKE